MPPPRRKKWTEAEEKTLIEKYGHMVSEGTLARMKTREKKFKPIALYVNSVHHVQDPVAYPWQWTWKDVSTKVQNMRHQYLLVKQKIKKPEFANSSVGDYGRSEEFDWVEGLTHWSNFLRYKEVFGDVPLVFNGSDSMAVLNGNDENGGGFAIVEFGHLGHEGFTDGIDDGGENGVLGLGFEYDGDEGDENFNDNCNDNGHDNDNNIDRVKEDVDDGYVYEELDSNGLDSRKKRKVLKGLERRAWGFLSNQLGQLREMEARFEQREAERERERQRREQERERKLEEREREREEREKGREILRREMIREWEAMDKDREERERRRREEELEWEERMNRRRLEWKKRIDEMLSQHQAEMGQVQSRILHEQQNITNQLLGIVTQWTHPSGIPDHTGTSSHYISQMMQNLHHVNGIVHGDTRVEDDNQDDQFIVDG